MRKKILSSFAPRLGSSVCPWNLFTCSTMETDMKQNHTISSNLISPSAFLITRQQRSYSWNSPGNRVGAGFYLPSPTKQSQDEAGDGQLITTSGELPDIAFPEPPSQNSVVAIFSMWSSMVGTTALAMPWAVAQAGLGFSVGAILGVALLAYYPLYLILRCVSHVQQKTGTHIYQFHEVCRQILGARVAVVSLVVSLFNLLSDMVCYWIMLSSLLFQIGNFVNGLRSSSDSPATSVTNIASGVNTMTTGTYWSESLSVPLYLVLLMLPIICLRYPTFFTKFSSWGIISIPFLMIVSIVQLGKFGVNLDADYLEPTLKFPALTGTLFLGFLVHNVVVSITAYQNQPQHRPRDVGIAVGLAAVTFLLLGTVYYIAYPGPKSEINDNFLRNFPTDDPLAFVARLLLFFQMLTMFPLLAFLFRVQLFYGWARRIDLGMHLIVILNVALVGVCLIFSALYPWIGDILRFGGAVCGLVYICILPATMDLVISYQNGQRVWLKGVVLTIYVALGVGNFVSQFLPSWL